MKREFKSGEVVLEVYDASLRIVMDRLLPPYEDNGECSYTINIAGNENFGGGFPREYVEKQVDEYLDTIRDFIIEGLISKGNIKRINMEGYKLNVEMAEELIPMLLYEMVNNDVITEEQANEVLNTVFDECLESNIEAKE